MSNTERRACVVVLGDIGRSPRMTFHSLSLARIGFKVDHVGYGGSTPSQSLLQNDNITINILPEPPAFLQKVPRIVGYGIKVIWVFFLLLSTLFKFPKHTHILVQNPPAVPMLAVVVLYSYFNSCKLIVDWHNYGYTILGLTMGDAHPIVKFTKWFEFYFGKKADAHLCVTKALKLDLKNNWNISATVLYDRPPDIFHPITIEEKHQLFRKLSGEYREFNSPDGENTSTAFTAETENGSSYLSNRPALIVSSTSWTVDEDFSILLEALKAYDQSIQSGLNKNIPKILCAITGKGPMKEYYSNLIDENQLQHVTFCLPWLTAEDYPKLLASADVGISLHTSSSGLDLPMKVVDMFGCGLPVIAYDFNCLSELVKHNENGLVFHSAQELKENLEYLLKGFPNRSDALTTFHKNLQEFQKLRWDQSWNACASSLFQ